MDAAGGLTGGIQAGDGGAVGVQNFGFGVDLQAAHGVGADGRSQLCVGVAGRADPAAAEPQPAAGTVYPAGTADPGAEDRGNSGKQQHPCSGGAGGQRLRGGFHERRTAAEPAFRNGFQRHPSAGLHPAAGIGGGVARRELSAPVYAGAYRSDGTGREHLTAKTALHRSGAEPF